MKDAPRHRSGLHATPGGTRSLGVAQSALRAKDLVRELATDLTDGHRRSTRYFKLRLAVIGGWAAISLLTVWLACPSAGPGNSLGAEVQMSEGLMEHRSSWSSTAPAGSGPT